MIHREAVRWGIKSVLGLLANLALLTVWVDVAGIAPELAIGVNWLLISVVGYLVTDRWVFKSVESPGTLRDHVVQYLGMQSVMSLGKLLNYGIYVALIQTGVDYRIAWVVGAVLVFVGSFGGNKLWWSTRQPTH